MNRNKAIKDFLGITLAVFAVVFIFAGTFSVWGSEMVRINDRCGKAPSHLYVVRLDLFCD